jgi:phosphoribosyl-ATP pyrophosphohydrolase/phosphoribosyl-AMP cyclohydrolase
LKYDAQGLVPAIVQDHITGEIRMFAFATDAAVRTTLDTGRATFWSRSRGELWQKGRVGGHEIPVVRVLADCDGDCVIYSSDPQGPSCHSGAKSCFFQILEGGRLAQASEPPQTILASLEADLQASKGPSREAAAQVGVKLREEAGSLAQALEGSSDERVVSEAADTLYQLLAGLGSRAIAFRRVLDELDRRAAKTKP